MVGPNRLTKRVLEWKPTGRRIRGRPRKRWIEDIEEDIQLIGIRGWRKLSKERTELRRITEKAVGCDVNKIIRKRTKNMHFLFPVYCEITASTCFKHYLLIFSRHCIYNNWYILCLLCRLVVSRVGEEPPNLLAASRHNTHKIYQLLYM
jgi:hypothetical protein